MQGTSNLVPNAIIAATMSRPSPLIAYVKSNNPIPEKLAPDLGRHLSVVSQSLAIVDAKIAELERTLELAKTERDPLEDERLVYAATKSALRRLPPGLIGMVFAYVLGDQAFGPREYRAFTRLGGVCRSWRNVVKTAPNLCRGLKIQLDDWPYDGSGAVLLAFWNGISPWLEVAGNGGAFELVLGGGRADDGRLAEVGYDGEYLEIVLHSPQCQNFRTHHQMGQCVTNTPRLRSTPSSACHYGT